MTDLIDWKTHLTPPPRKKREITLYFCYDLCDDNFFAKKRLPRRIQRFRLTMHWRSLCMPMLSCVGTKRYWYRCKPRSKFVTDLGQLSLVPPLSCSINTHFILSRWNSKFYNSYSTTNEIDFHSTRWMERLGWMEHVQFGLWVWISHQSACMQ